MCWISPNNQSIQLEICGYLRNPRDLRSLQNHVLARLMLKNLPAFLSSSFKTLHNGPHSGPYKICDHPSDLRHPRSLLFHVPSHKAQIVRENPLPPSHPCSHFFPLRLGGFARDNSLPVTAWPTKMIYAPLIRHQTNLAMLRVPDLTFGVRRKATRSLAIWISF